MYVDRLNILYVGPDYPGSNGTCWRDAFLELGMNVATVDSEEAIPPARGLSGKLLQKLRGRPPRQAVTHLNSLIVCTARDFKPALTFYIQGRNVLADTLEETRKFGPNFAYMNDDMFNPSNQYFSFYDVIRRIDCILTTKSYNVPEFHDAEAPRAVFIPNAYDPRIHYPAEPLPEERARYEGDVAFIGTFRPERADFLSRLADSRRGFSLGVWGGGWEKMSRILYALKWSRWRALRSCIRGKELWCGDMGKAIQVNKIALGLLNHANRDLHTSRSFEIPACGGFMLAERTDEHLTYFEEDKEAVYFSSFEEMVQKVLYYLAREKDRRRISRAAYERCLRSSYRYVDRARFALGLWRV